VKAATAVETFPDRLEAETARKSSVLCVGLDPRLDRTPEDVLEAAGGDPAAALRRFCEEVLDLVAPHAACVKPNVAFFEEHGVSGLAAYAAVLAAARRRGLLVIADVKRGDIGSTAEAYARAHLRPGADFEADAVTASPYLGGDSLLPLVEEAMRAGKGVYVLVRTSNAGARDLQDLACDGAPLHERTAALVRSWGEASRGASGLSSVGAVVGATWPEEATRLRALLPSTPFLVPGYGAQGASAADVAAAFLPGGRGAVVNASRSILYAAGARPGTPWRDAVAQAARRAREELQDALRRP
jgi:orotidine-5'-phosphate decarboxylase